MFTNQIVKQMFEEMGLSNEDDWNRYRDMGKLSYGRETNTEPISILSTITTNTEEGFEDA